MVDQQGEISNSELLETLEEWNNYLEHHVPHYQEPQP